eukprot:jgi/Botrbrau1/15654/Bobra.4_1s0038.1
MPVALSLTCPKIGVVLDVGLDWSAKIATAVENEFQHVCLRLQDIELHLSATGAVSLKAGYMEAGGMSTADAPLHDVALRSPSARCVRLLRAADLHGSSRGEERGFASALARQPGPFLMLDMEAKPGVVGRARAEGHPAVEVGDIEAGVQASPGSMSVRPPGLSIESQMEGVEVIHSAPVIVAVLHFLHQLQGIQKLPLDSTAALPNLDAAPCSSLGNTCITDLVKLAFAVNNIPVHVPLTLPIVTVDFFCPGVVASIAYTHAKRQDPGAPAGTQGGPGPSTTLGNQYQLVATVTRIKIMSWGEGFRDFMQSLTVRRGSLQFYLDLFLYQAPSLRRRIRPICGGPPSPQLQEEVSVTDVGFPGRLVPLSGAGGPRKEAARKKPSGRDAATSTREVSNGRGLLAFLQEGSADPFRPSFPLHAPSFKVAALEIEVSDQVHCLPAAPGATAISVALAMTGVCIWVSPLQLEHLVSMQSSLLGTLAATWQPAAQMAASTVAGAGEAVPSGLPVGEVQAGGTAGPSWGTNFRVPRRVSDSALRKKTDAAVLYVGKFPSSMSCARYLGDRIWGPVAPVPCGQTGCAPHTRLRSCISVEPGAGTRCTHLRSLVFAGMRGYAGTGALNASVTIDGMLSRDINQNDVKYRYFLRPLPVRTAVLEQYAIKYRRRMLRMLTYSKALRRWKRAVRMVILRRRADLQWTYDVERAVRCQLAGKERPRHRVESHATVGTTGHQVRVLFLMHPAVMFPGNPDYQPPAPADLRVEVGQMVIFSRVNKHRPSPFIPLVLESMRQVLEGGAPRMPPAPAGPAPDDAGVSLSRPRLPRPRPSLGSTRK